MHKRKSKHKSLRAVEEIEGLQDAHRPYRLLFERNPQSMLVYDAESLAILAVNQAVVEQYGYSREEILRMNIRDITPAQDLPALLKLVARQTQGFHRSGEWRLRKKDASFIEVDIATHDIDWAGRSARLLLAVDVTQRKRAEERLRQSEDSYRRLVELSPDAMLVHRNGKIIFANAASLSLFKASRVEDLVGRPVLDLVHPEDREAIWTKMSSFTPGEPPLRIERKYSTLEGQDLDLELVVSPLMYEGELALQAIYRDISERKKAEKKLRQSEANLAAAQRIAHLGSYEMDLAGGDEFAKNPLRWSEENFRIFGYEPGKMEVSGITFLRTVHPEDKARMGEEIKKAISGGTSVTLEYRIIRPDGDVRFIRSQTNVVYDEKTNKPIRLVGTAQDITERKKADERFHKAFNLSPEPMMIGTIIEGRYVDVNESFLRVTGYQREEVVGRTTLELNFFERPEDRARMVELLKQYGSVRNVEFTFRTKTGELRIALNSAEVMELAGEKCIIATFKDVTEQKILETQLRQSQKMEAIGQFSGGIAHDFNNLLGVIIGYSEDLEDRLPQSDSLHTDVKQIKKAAESAASLTRQLLAFSRQQVLEPKVLDLNATVRKVEEMLQRLIGEHIDLQFSPDPALGHIKADEGQIQQVIMNLAVNARDAMPRGGRLTIATANVDLDEGYTRFHPPQLPGQYVLLSVSDTGIGMDATTQAHIFEPFFTTKETGKGTGLGLSTVYGVIRQSGGHVWVYSEVGLGTTFKIYLPRTSQPTLDEKPAVTVTGSFRGTETILLVEDEPALRELTHTFLTGSGYTVLEAESPDQAVEIARHHSSPIHLLLTDVVMPGMSGPELADKLAPALPEMRVLFMSGYTGFTHPRHLDSETPLLQKPFTRDELRGKVREVLNAAAFAKLS